MNNLTIIQQKPADKKWFNEAAEAIPYDRTKASERLSERKLAPLAKKRIALRDAIEKHKEECFATARELYAAFLAENDGVNNRSKGKGNIIRYNFDRSIKIEINVNEAIVFDESLLQLAKDTLDEMLNDNLSTVKDWLKPIIMAAFTTKKGKSLDTSRVLELLRHEESVPDERYKTAMRYIRQAIRKPKSKEYFGLFVRDEKGHYVDVHLNFSNI